MEITKASKNKTIVTISKSEWQLIGKQTGWIKKAELSYEKEEKRKSIIIRKILDSIDGERGERSVEIGYDDPLGESYIQASIPYDKTRIKVQKYFENEFVNNMHGMEKDIVIDFNNPMTTIEQLKETIENMKKGV